MACSTVALSELLNRLRRRSVNSHHCAVTAMVGMGQQSAVVAGALAVTLARPVCPASLVFMMKSVTPTMPLDPIRLM
jgi:hypothetical protein